VQVQTAAATHTGLVRSSNQDAHLSLSGLAVVADGMGGHASGEVASALAIAAFERLGETPLTTDDVLEAVGRGNAAILAEGAAHPEKAGMGTTLTGVALVETDGPHWLVFNVGDSRVYHVGPEGLAQVTEDHSEVAALVAAGRLTAEEARSHPLRNVITRSLGMEPAPVVDTWLLPVVPGDLYLACSDGLTGELTEDEIARCIADTPGLQEAADALVTAAVAAGGRDNVTVVLIGSAPADH
jgi:serine/threonine protein phosphatase PrpC